MRDVRRGRDSIRDVKRVTLKDVAQRAGVSAAAASLAMSGKGRISEVTRDRIYAAMDDLGYVYHRGAASLRTQKSSIVGLLVTDISNPFFASMTVGFQEQLGQDGYLTVLTNTFDDPDRQAELIRVLTEQSVDALVYVPATGGDSSFALPSNPDSIPALAVTRRPRSDVPYLGPDDRAGGRLAAQHLVEVHHRRRLIYLGGPPGAWTREERLGGVRDYLCGLPDVTLTADLAGPTSITSGLELANRLMDGHQEFDAVICHSDILAFSFISAYLDRGKPLEGISVVGFDGLPESAVYNPPITSVSVGPENLGRRAARRIHELLQGQQPGTELLPPVLEIRRSCGCKPSP